jgi:hypothetical protein
MRLVPAYRQPTLCLGMQTTTEPGLHNEATYKLPTYPRLKYLKAALRQFSSQGELVFLSKFQVKCATVAVLGQKPTRVRFDQHKSDCKWHSDQTCCVFQASFSVPGAVFEQNVRCVL